MAAEKKKTMQDIADDLGLSRLTVSSVLNGKIEERHIAAETVKKVRDYVRETGFHQNLSALSMRGKYSKDIGIVFSHGIYPANRRLYFSLAEFLNINNISFESFFFSKDNLGELIRQIDFFGVKRLIVIASHFLTSSEVENIVRLRTECKNLRNCYFYDLRPALLNHEQFRNGGDSGSYVCREDRVPMIAGYLKERGYRKVFILSVHGRYESADWAEAGLQVESIPYTASEYKVLPLNYQRDESNMQYGRMLAKRYGNYCFSKEKCCFYTHDDFVAAGMLRQFIDDGFRIPDDFGVLSWDNLPDAEYFTLPLTSFGLPHRRMFEHICNWIDGKVKKQMKQFKIVMNKGKTV